MQQKAAPPDLRAARKIREGVVVSDKMNKTRVVSVSWHTKHARYRKVMRRNGHFYAHDEANETHTGDKVQIVETRPLSRLKRWRIVRVIEKSI
jgi:small subunit ribosomal protein S17